MRDVPNGVFLPWKSKRQYRTGYDWHSSVLIARGPSLSDLYSGFLEGFLWGVFVDVSAGRLHGSGTVFEGVPWDPESP
jgi:hypothetical protein